jgi:acetyl-CoA C-acetyltransferase
METVVVVTACRTPAGRLLGQLSPLSAPQLAARVIAEAVRRAGIKPSLVDEVILGHVVAAGCGQNPARQATLAAGLPPKTPAFTVDKVCASGMKAVALGAQAIRLGEAEVVVAGGMESMSNAPHLLPEMRHGRRYGNGTTVDAMLNDGLWDPYHQAHMGSLCELTVKKYVISREDQDRFAQESHRRAAAANDAGHFREEIVPVAVFHGGKETIVTADETIRRETTIAQLSSLRPAFDETGTITAGNAPGLNDGAAALLLMSGTTARRLKLEPLAEIIATTSAHLAPRWYPLAPCKAVRSLLRSTGLTLADFDLIEENEAFAAQSLAVQQELGIDPERLNVHGGAIALGHPIGASGARILVTLIHTLRQRKGKMGLATLCLGGGGAMAMAVKVYSTA